ncbi:hypothetical protein [Polaromonas sp. AER18D-145]|uniref:hypothetical protein n=1 Tax=Polaromonas sp. AER18D-145 TaxID=1977060 RepID=UPI000BBB7D0C|nr:hypothetical protein [Polaromonas sp. AER18D-145]
MSSTQIYRHPDGFDISFAPGLLNVTNDDGDSVAVPIGLLGITKRVGKLNAIGDDAVNLAEQAGAGIAIDYLNAMLATRAQVERVAAMQTAILDLQRLPHPGHAARGAAAAMLNVLKRGLGLSK